MFWSENGDRRLRTSSDSQACGGGVSQPIEPFVRGSAMTGRRWRWLLRLLPGSFLEEHEREMLRAWRDEERESRAEGRSGV